MTQKIFITGHGGSGTTLMLRLFQAFKGGFVVFREESPERFIERGMKDYEFLVAKRPNPFTPQIWNNMISQVKNQKLKILYMVRDGRDLLKRTRPETWIQGVNEYITNYEYISCVIRYEDLVTIPNVQQERIAKTFGLKRIHYFSSYPSFVPYGMFQVPSHTPKKHEPRPISRDRIGLDHSKYNELKGDIKEKFDEYLRLFKYI